MIPNVLINIKALKAYQGCGWEAHATRNIREFIWWLFVDWMKVMRSSISWSNFESAEKFWWGMVIPCLLNLASAVNKGVPNCRIIWLQVRANLLFDTSLFTCISRAFHVHFIFISWEVKSHDWFYKVCRALSVITVQSKYLAFILWACLVSCAPRFRLVIVSTIHIILLEPV